MVFQLRLHYDGTFLTVDSQTHDRDLFFVRWRMTDANISYVETPSDEAYAYRKWTFQGPTWLGRITIYDDATEDTIARNGSPLQTVCFYSQIEAEGHNTVICREVSLDQIANLEEMYDILEELRMEIQTITDLTSDDITDGLTMSLHDLMLETGA